MIKFTKKYNDKIDACLSAITLLNADKERIVGSYRRTRFPKSRVEKSELFGNILNKKLSCSQFQYLTDQCGLARFRDKRCPHEYGVDLILGWLVEDAVLDRLVNEGLNSRLFGEDKKREFLNIGKISAIPDIEIDTKTGKRYIDVFTDWSNTWKKKNHADLRYDKYPCLVEHNAFLLGVSPHANAFFLIELTQYDSLFKESVIGAWGKRGYTYKGIKDDLTSLNVVIDHLKSL